MKKRIVLMAFASVIMSNAQQVPAHIERDAQGYPCSESIEQVCQTVPLSVDDVQRYDALARQEVAVLVEQLTHTPAEQQNKNTVLYVLDRAYMWIRTTAAPLYVVGELSSDKEVSALCSSRAAELNTWGQEIIFANASVFKAYDCYRKGTALVEQLSDQERHLMKYFDACFAQAGFYLDASSRADLLEITKRVWELDRIFMENVRNNPRRIIFSAEDLSGLDEKDLASFAKNAEGYVVPVNWKNYELVLNKASKQQTRKHMYTEFYKQGYPENVPVVQELIALHDKRAKLQGFESYVAEDIQSGMQSIESEDMLLRFIQSMQQHMVPAETAKIKMMTQELPAGVALTKDGKLNIWDYFYVRAHYCTQRCAIDMQQIKEHFPLEETISRLFAVYEKFFDIKMQYVPCTRSWHPDVRLVKISTNNGQLLGYVFLDLFTREVRREHPSNFTYLNGVTRGDRPYPVVSVVSCPFGKPTDELPSLLSYWQISTFFHEFGHALHKIWATPRAYSQAGVGHHGPDFFEVPAHLLEYWISDKEILKSISCHYQTGEALSDDQITSLLEYARYDYGAVTPTPVALCLTSWLLFLFGPGAEKDISSVIRSSQREMAPALEFGDSEEYRYCSQAHIGLWQYRYRYYGYPWARALASLLFEQIKPQGLLNPEAGKRYVEAVLRHGSSKPALEMVRAYLGCEPDFESYFQKVGMI